MSTKNFPCIHGGGLGISNGLACEAEERVEIVAAFEDPRFPEP